MAEDEGVPSGPYRGGWHAASNLTNNLGSFSRSFGGSRHATTNGDGLASPARVESSGWSGIFNIGSGSLFGTVGGPRIVLARADSFTGPPQRALPFNLEEDEESVDSGMWGKNGLGFLLRWWRQGPRAVHGQVRRGRTARAVPGGRFEFPVHAVRRGDSVTFLPTPLRNWWGRPSLLRAWQVLSVYVIVVMAFKLGVFYFLSTSLIIFPTAIGAALLGLVGSVRYFNTRRNIQSFDTSVVVELTKLLALLAGILTLLVTAAYIALELGWTLRRGACDGASLTECNAVDLCADWSPCYATPPAWINGTVDLTLAVVVLTAVLPYTVVSMLVFRRARAASYYLVDNML